jgi:hypothetical protein
MRIEDLILRVMIWKDNKLSKRKANSSSMAPKEKVIKQVVKTHNRNYKKKMLRRGMEMPRN